jgi:hypothetical protein
VEDDGEQEQAYQQGPTEELIWKVNNYKIDGIGIPMADSLRAMVLRLGYAKAQFTTASSGLTHGLSPTGRFQLSCMRMRHSREIRRYPGMKMWLTGPPWTQESQKQHGWHSMYSPTKSVIG